MFLRDTYVTKSGRVNLEYTLKKIKLTTLHAMHALKRAMKWDEDEYNRNTIRSFMIVAIDHFNMGNENKGLNIFNSNTF